ncbi:hypothetical protein [Brazilian marseillevirus]|uniref:hypothetical protein n=1 Tax=Brazilian marseillevirus TaxID=1813599 RepID=UPI000786736E|nr:hypothetical protein A3303_gp211 [Brazilian marseillevirus]AMQ10719.1 hypothetical protein [Brazilian marseillevirus]
MLEKNMDRFLHAKDLLSFATVCPVEFKEKEYEKVTEKEGIAEPGTNVTFIAEAKGKAMYCGDVVCGPFSLTVITRIKDSTNYVRYFIEGCNYYGNIIGEEKSTRWIAVNGVETLQ